jgi:hypothetical protein
MAYKVISRPKLATTVRKYAVVDLEDNAQRAFLREVARRKLRMSNAARTEFDNLIAGALPLIRLRENGYQQALESVDTLLRAAARSANSQSRRLAGQRVRGRPKIAVGDIRAALNALCPFWPFC